MILFDTTNVSSWRHTSGLVRVSRRLLGELGASASAVRWPRMPRTIGRADWFLTPELFCEAERPGFTAFLESRPCRLAAIFHDAIPLKHPDIAWPASVGRHPGYMKLLARFDRVWAVSRASRDELLAFWKWQGVAGPPEVGLLQLGADWAGVPRATEPAAEARPRRIVSIGIIEPRKNQGALLDAFEALGNEGAEMELHLVGRVNPHFGRPIARRASELAAKRPGLVRHGAMDDGALADLVRPARATAFASIAEGCGLPILESLWMGVPCVCSDIAPVLESAAGGGCAVVSGNAPDGWRAELGRILGDDAHHARLSAEARARALPTWAAAAAALRSALN